MQGADPTDKEEALAASFRQSRKELRFMVVTWCCFAAWTAVYNGLYAKGTPGEPVALVFGFPSWVFFGIALPWTAALAVTIWFALRYMQDTDLGEDAGSGTDVGAVRDEEREGGAER